VVRCKINFCVFNFFFFWFVGSPEALKIENSHMKVKNWSCPISIWYFFWLRFARWFQKCKNFVVWRSALNVTGQNDQKIGEIWKFHIFWPYIWPQVVVIEVPYRYIGQLQFLSFWQFSFFKASGLPTNLKKKISTQKLILHLITAF
jgi:hypothetical protein